MTATIATGPIDGEAKLVRVIGTWGLAASIVNVTIGGGIFRLPGSAAVTGRLAQQNPLLMPQRDDGVQALAAFSFDAIPIIHATAQGATACR